MSADGDGDEPVGISEIAALTARLRALSDAGPAADPGERERFGRDRDRLVARIRADLGPVDEAGAVGWDADGDDEPDVHGPDDGAGDGWSL